MCQTCVHVPVFTHTPPHTPPASSETCLRELCFMLRPCSVSSWSSVCLTCLTDGKKCSPECGNFCSSLIFSQILPNHSQMAESESRVSVFNRRKEREGRLRLAVEEEVGRAHEKMAQRGWWEQTSQPSQGMRSPACPHAAPSTCSLSLLRPLRCALRWLCSPGCVGESGGLCRAFLEPEARRTVAWTGGWPRSLPDPVALSALQSPHVHNKHISPWSPFEYKTFIFFTPAILLILLICEIHQSSMTSFYYK